MPPPKNTFASIPSHIQLPPPLHRIVLSYDPVFYPALSPPACRFPSALALLWFRPALHICSSALQRNSALSHFWESVTSCRWGRQRYLQVHLPPYEHHLCFSGLPAPPFSSLRAERQRFCCYRGCLSWGAFLETKPAAAVLTVTGPTK